MNLTIFVECEDFYWTQSDFYRDMVDWCKSAGESVHALDGRLPSGQQRQNHGRQFVRKRGAVDPGVPQHAASRTGAHHGASQHRLQTRGYCGAQISEKTATQTGEGIEESKLNWWRQSSKHTVLPLLKLWTWNFTGNILDDCSTPEFSISRLVTKKCGQR